MSLLKHHLLVAFDSWQDAFQRKDGKDSNTYPPLPTWLRLKKPVSKWNSCVVLSHTHMSPQIGSLLVFNKKPSTQDTGLAYKCGAEFPDSPAALQKCIPEGAPCDDKAMKAPCCQVDAKMPMSCKPEAGGVLVVFAFWGS